MSALPTSARYALGVDIGDLVLDAQSHGATEHEVITTLRCAVFTVTLDGMLADMLAAQTLSAGPAA